MIGEQLKRNHGEYRHHAIGCFREGDNFVGNIFKLAHTVAAGQRNDRTLTSFDLLDVIEVLREDSIVWGDKNRGQIGTNQRNNAVLELGAGMAFGEQVCDLLHFERAFQRDGKIELPAKKKHPANIEIFLCDRFNPIAQLQDDLDLLGQCFERFNDPASLSGGKISHSTEEQTDQRKDDNLRGEGFRRCDADLRTGVHVNAAVALPCNCAGDVIANPQRAKAFAAAFTERTESVSSLAALADCENQCLRRHWCITVAKFAREFDFSGNIRESLNQIFADPSGMQSSATTGENNAPDVTQLRWRHIQAAQLRRAFFQTEATPQRIAHRIRLLKDFFEHVVGVSAFFDIFGRKFDFADLMIATFASQRADLEFASLHRDDIKVI